VIAQLHGTIVEKQPPTLVIKVSGVCYEIDAPMSTFYYLPALGQETVLHTHLVVREDAHNLYGFYSKHEKLLFKDLLKVNGVGPRLALSILSSSSTDEFVCSVINHDAARLATVPGVGKKTAERLIIEMKDKLAGWPYNNGLLTNTVAAIDTKQLSWQQQELQDAISALIALGYKAAVARKAAAKVQTETMNSEIINEKLVILML
jgi:Holliday junction DNA helicase RuvA